MHLRPSTPLVKILNDSKGFQPSIENENKNKEQINIQENQNDYYLKNFNSFMRQIVDSQNDVFLSGKKQLVKYVLSQYLQIPEEELDKLTKLSIKIVHDYGLLNQFGTYLPNLILLKLNDCNILNFSDIGVNYGKIRCLQINSSHLRDLTGIVCMQELEVLDVEDNDIKELVELDMCNNLKQINLRKNKISDKGELVYLSSLDNLNYLCVLDNPLCQSDDLDGYITPMFENCHKLIFKSTQEKLVDNIVKLFDEKNVVPYVPKKKMGEDLLSNKTVNHQRNESNQKMNEKITINDEPKNIPHLDRKEEKRVTEKKQSIKEENKNTDITKLVQKSKDNETKLQEDDEFDYKKETKPKVFKETTNNNKFNMFNSQIPQKRESSNKISFPMKSKIVIDASGTFNDSSAFKNSFNGNATQNMNKTLNKQGSSKNIDTNEMLSTLHKKNLLKPIKKAENAKPNNEDQKNKEKFVANNIANKSIIIHNTPSIPQHQEETKKTFNLSKLKSNPVKLLVNKEKKVIIKKNK